MKNYAIIVVDMLYDFIDGSLACKGADSAVAQTRKLILQKTDVDEIDKDGICDTVPVVFIRDHHPANHCSFKENGGIWPVHCVAGTRGGDIHEDLREFVCEELTFDKGADPACEQYSGSEGVNCGGQSLVEVLELLGVSEVLVCGIATEFCVYQTASDLQKAGFKVTVAKDCLAWVDDQGHMDTLAKMQAEGMKLI